MEGRGEEAEGAGALELGVVVLGDAAGREDDGAVFAEADDAEGEGGARTDWEVRSKPRPRR